NEGGARFRLAELGVEVESNLNEAIALYENAESIFRDTGNELLLMSVKLNLGYLFYTLKDYQSAYQNYKEGIEIVEEIRYTIRNPEDRRKFQEKYIEAYKNMVYSCIKLGKDREAFEYAERAKSRSFVELLASKAEAEVDRKTRKRLEELQFLLESDGFGELRQIEGQMMMVEVDVKSKTKNKAKSKTKAKTESKINKKEILDELNRIYSEIIGRFLPPGFKLEPTSPEDLKFEGTILEYFIADEVIAFVINDGELQVKLLSEGLQIKNRIEGLVKELIEITKKIVNYLKFNAGYHKNCISNIERAREILEELYRYLIEPLEKEKLLKNRIIIIPHGVLHYIPFQALMDGEKYLIEKYSISFAPSATSIRYILERREFELSNRALLVYNESNLRFSKPEIERIFKILSKRGFDLDILPDKEVEPTKKEILGRIERKRIVHFAGHARFNSENPRLSGLLLKDGYLTILDLLSVNLSSELITLSACETAMGIASRGDEIDNLVRAIQLRGGRFVIATLWSVDDRKTFEIMEEFYRNLDSKNPVYAMRETLLNFIKKKMNFTYWAPFQVYGV
ncbi:MAG: CHAT domain-containing protein, partial [Archaeoglobus sp.]|nr:CHAT domain-containing protein [Archaeoglobus sp.]